MGGTRVAAVGIHGWKEKQEELPTKNFVSRWPGPCAPGMKSPQAIPNERGVAIFAALAPEKVRHNLQHLPRGKGCSAGGWQGQGEQHWRAGRAVLGQMIGDGVTGVRPQDGALVFHHFMQGAFLMKCWSWDARASLIPSLEGSCAESWQDISVRHSELGGGKAH